MYVYGRQPSRLPTNRPAHHLAAGIPGVEPGPKRVKRQRVDPGVDGLGFCR